MSVSTRAGAALSPAKISRACFSARVGFGRLPECRQAAALSKQRERLLGDGPELLPAFGRLGVAVGSGLLIAAGLAEGGAHRDWPEGGERDGVDS